MNKNYILEMGKDINNIEKSISDFLGKYNNIGAKNIDLLLKISDDIRLVNAKLEKKYFNDLMEMKVNPHLVFLGRENSD